MNKFHICLLVFTLFFTTQNSWSQDKEKIKKSEIYDFSALKVLGKPKIKRFKWGIDPQVEIESTDSNNRVIYEINEPQMILVDLDIVENQDLSAQINLENKDNRRQLGVKREVKFSTLSDKDQLCQLYANIMSIDQLKYVPVKKHFQMYGLLSAETHPWNETVKLFSDGSYIIDKFQEEKVLSNNTNQVELLKLKLYHT